MIEPGKSSFETAVTLEGSKTGVVEEPPFRIMALGNWSGDSGGKPLSERRPLDIDRDNFDAILARMGTRLDLEIENRTLSLAFAELDDFHPDRIFRQLPVFGELRDLRRRLKDEGSFHAAVREAREKLPISDSGGAAAAVRGTEPIASGEPPPADNLLDAILSAPSGGAAAPRAGVSGELGRLIQDLVRPHLVSVDETEQSQVLAALDSAAGDLMRGILHNRKFQELEAAWRGLYFLVKHADTSTEMKISVLDISKAELSENLKASENLSETILYRHLIRDAIETPGGEPWAVVIGNYAFEPVVDDIAALMRIGKLSAAANAPFVAHMRPDVLGIHSLADSPETRTWKIDENSDAGRLWETLRRQPASEYLGMTIPRLLMRLPYGHNTDPLETFSFEEFDDAPGHNQYLWSNGSFAVGRLLAESFASYGWEMGRALKQDIEGLPVHIYSDGGETVYKPCSEALMTQEACERLMEYGLMPLVTYKNTDHVKLGRFQSIANPVTGLKGMWS